MLNKTNVEMMCQDMGMIAEKLIVLWPVYLGRGVEKHPPPAAFIPFYRLHVLKDNIINRFSF